MGEKLCVVLLISSRTSGGFIFANLIYSLFKHRELYFSLKGSLQSTKVMQAHISVLRTWNLKEAKTDKCIFFSVLFFITFQIQQLCFVSKPKKSCLTSLNKEIDSPSLTHWYRCRLDHNIFVLWYFIIIITFDNSKENSVFIQLRQNPGRQFPGLNIPPNCPEMCSLSLTKLKFSKRCFK